MASRSLAWAGAVIVWLLFPLVTAMAWHVVSDRLILQDSGRRWIAAGGAAVVYALVGLWLFGWRVPGAGTLSGGGAARGVAFLIAWALLAGYYAGPLALALANSAGDRSPPRTVILKNSGARLRALVRLRPTDPDFGNVTFTCSRRAWQAAQSSDPRAGVAAAVRRGRLGMLWALLPPPRAR